MATKLADKLRHLRAIAGRSLRQVEDQTGISNAYLSQLESGKAENPSPHVLHKLASVYRVPYQDLMEAAGYIKKAERSAGLPRRVSTLQYALLSAELTEEEEKQVAEYVKFLRSQRHRRKA